MKTSDDDLVYLLLLEQENLYPFHASQTGASGFILSSTSLTMQKVLLIMT